MKRFARALSQSSALRAESKESWGRKNGGKTLAQNQQSFYQHINQSLNSHAPDSIAPRFWPSINLNSRSTYNPSDMSFENRNRGSRVVRNERTDEFRANNIDPLSLWTNPVILSHYITANGRIKPGYANGVKGSTQRKLAKAIRRCRASGLLSHTHKDVSFYEK